MEEIIFRPELHFYKTVKEFVDACRIDKDDLVVTNRFIFEPFIEPLNVECQTMFVEEYGTGEPTDDMVNAMIHDMKDKNVKHLFAIGGGTVLDISKVLAIANGKDTDTLYDEMPAFTKNMELIAVPTTCGTGSEVTNIAILNRVEKKTKKGLVGKELYADTAILVPEFLKSLPYHVFATSSIDALIHASESSLSPKATPYTKLFGYKAIEMILKGYMRLRDEGKQILEEMYEDFLIASNYAGLAFGTAGCGPVHAMGYPLSGAYHVTHGESCYEMFMGVWEKYQKENPGGAYADYSEYVAGILGCSLENVNQELTVLLDTIVPFKALSEYGVEENELPGYARSVIDEQQRLMQNGFISLDYDDVLEIYQNIYKRK